MVMPSKFFAKIPLTSPASEKSKLDRIRKRRITSGLVSGRGAKKSDTRRTNIPITTPRTTPPETYPAIRIQGGGGGRDEYFIDVPRKEFCLEKCSRHVREGVCNDAKHHKAGYNKLNITVSANVSDSRSQDRSEYEEIQN